MLRIQFLSRAVLKPDQEIAIVQKAAGHALINREILPYGRIFLELILLRQIRTVLQPTMYSLNIMLDMRIVISTTRNVLGLVEKNSAKKQTNEMMQ
jgi:hypothetical protein